MLRWSPNSQWLCLVSGQQLKLFQPDGTAGPKVECQKIIDELQWSPDSTRLITRHLGHAELITISEASRVLLNNGDGTRLWSVRWSFDGNWIVTSSKEKTVRLWKSDGTPGPPIETPSGTVSGMDWHPRTNQLAMAGDDGSVRIVQTDGSVAAEVPGDAKDPVEAVYWSPNGKLISTFSETGRLAVRDDKGKLVRDFSSGEKTSYFSRHRQNPWWPNNQGLFVHSGERNSIVALPLKKGSPSILPNPVPHGVWDWSPTQKHIVFWYGGGHCFGQSGPNGNSDSRRQTRTEAPW